MPSLRVGFGSDFVVKDQRVGIGTADPRATLDVVGTLKGDLNLTGVTTLTTYSGFTPQKQSVDNVIITTSVTTISEDIIVELGKTFTVSAGSTAKVGTLDNVSIGTHFSVPNGGIAARTEEPVEGMVRFNNDLNTLEFYNGVEWRQFTVTGASGRGVFNTGYTVPGFAYPKTYEFINISTQGNAVNFGTLTEAVRDKTGCSSSTRGLFGGGLSPSKSNVIEYITIASEGNGIDFGDLISENGHNKSCSSSTRGLWGGGYTSALFVNVINYVQISTLGNALDFGDLTYKPGYPGACANATRGIFAGGVTPGNQNSGLDTIDFVTISSLGNAVNFGSLSAKRTRSGASANSIRGIFYTGNPDSASVKSMEYITISSTGNGVIFGDLSIHKTALGATTSSTRGVCAGGEASTSGTGTNAIEFINIQSLGNAQDFGDLANATSFVNACSDSHGGLGGF